MIFPLMILGGLMGASGVALAAAAAHVAPDSGLEQAANLLMIHAAAVLAAAALARQGLLARGLGTTVMAGFVLGGTLFAGDIAMRAFAGHRLFPMAAPTGGTLMIASWLVLALAAALRGSKSPPGNDKDVAKTRSP